MSLIRFMPPRGTNAQCNLYVGTLGELFVDTDTWQLRMSDGATPGGHVQGGISNLVGCSDVSIASTGPAYAAGQYLRWGANLLSAPVQSAPSTSTSGGTLAAATYYYVVTALNAYGETTISNEKSQVTTGSTSKNTISWAAVTGATAYRIYRGTSAGAENVYYQVGAVTSYVDTGAAATSGSPPTVNTSGSWENAQIAASEITGLATSATTNASNISSGTLGAARLPAFTGDVTTSAGSSATTIAAAAVTLAKMANLAANSIIGNNTGSAATPVALTASQVKTLLAIGAADVAAGTFTGAFTIAGGASTSLTLSQSSGSPWALVLTRSDLTSAADVKLYNSATGTTPILTTNCLVNALNLGLTADSSTLSFNGTASLESVTGASFNYGSVVAAGAKNSYVGVGLNTTPKAQFMSSTSGYGLYSEAWSKWMIYCDNSTVGHDYQLIDRTSGGAYPHYNSSTYASGKITVQSGGSASGGSSGDIFFIY